MATLYVENVPDDLYAALRKQARAHRKSIAAEVIELLARYVPTEEELRRRARFYEQVIQWQAEKPLGPGPFPSAEEMVREDRKR